MGTSVDKVTIGGHANPTTAKKPWSQDLYTSKLEIFQIPALLRNLGIMIQVVHLQVLVSDLLSWSCLLNNLTE